jgi:hypothetical protein
MALPCETQKDVATGTLCVITPSKTDHLISDTFGNHVVGLPKTASPRGIWVHLTGTGGQPYYPRSKRYLNETWDGELMGKGYVVLDLAYDNVVSVTESCSSAEGKTMNNCAGDLRLEVLTGVNTSSLRSVDLANSVTFRVRALLDFMADNGFLLPNGYAKWQGDWSVLSVSGHSQGAGDAYYLAKNMGVKFGCFLGGPYDVTDNVPHPQQIADWYLDPNLHNTPVKQMGAFVTTADDSYNAFVGAYGLIYLTKNREWFESNQLHYTDAVGKPLNGHAASVQDPSLAPLRAKACFRN